MTKKYIEFVANTFLLSETQDTDKNYIAQHMSFNIAEFKKGDVIYSDEQKEKKIGFVYSGEAIVNKGKIHIKSILPGDSFGILSLFSDSYPYPTQIKSCSACKILFIDETEIERLMSEYPCVSRSIIRFLSEKIFFLNEKISEYGMQTAEEKLASFLLNKSSCEDSVTLTQGKKTLAESLSVGRASLYRALDSLISAGAIETDGKNIKIKDKKYLEDILK